MLVFNARTQQDEEVTWSKVANGEIIATFKDGGFIKFPLGSTKEEIEELAAKHRDANLGQEVISPEEEKARAETEEKTQSLVDELNADATAESDKTNASTESEQQNNS